MLVDMRNLGIKAVIVPMPHAIILRILFYHILQW